MLNMWSRSQCPPCLHIVLVLKLERRPQQDSLGLWYQEMKRCLLVEDKAETNRYAIYWARADSRDRWDISLLQLVV